MLARLDWVVEQSLKRGLKVVIDNHHHEALFKNPAVETPRYLAVWQQIAQRYRDTNRYPNHQVYFELLNEPAGSLSKDTAAWNNLLRQTISVIRRSNPHRPIIIGGVLANSPWTLPSLELPPDSHLIATFHYYYPHRFTHQGADWAWPQGEQPRGQTWIGSDPILAAEWQMGSWFETTHAFTPNLELRVNFTAWGGVYLAPPMAVEGMNTLRLQTQGPAKLLITCNLDGEQYKEVASPANGRTLQIPFSELGCAKTSGIKIASSAPQTVVFRHLSLQGPLGTISLFTDQRSQLAETFAYVARWAATRNLPVYLGEFGVHGTPKQPNFEFFRRRWVGAVRRQAEQHRFGWAFWSFSSSGDLANSFGIYDRETSRWHLLLERLIPR